MRTDAIQYEALIQALTEHVEARQAHDKARDKFHADGGYSWGYYGESYVRECERTAMGFGDRLREIIRSEIAQVGTS